MPAKNAATVAQKWRDRLQAATQEMTDGVRAVTKAPGQAAAEKADVMKARLLEALNSGKWARKVASVGLADWQNAMITVGIPRVGQGAAEKMAKVERFMTKFLPFVDNVKKQVAAMPNVTDQDRKNRMLKNFDLMKQFQAS